MDCTESRDASKTQVVHAFLCLLDGRIRRETG